MPPRRATNQHCKFGDWARTTGLHVRITKSRGAWRCNGIHRRWLQGVARSLFCRGQASRAWPSTHVVGARSRSRRGKARRTGIQAYWLPDRRLWIRRASRKRSRVAVRDWLLTLPLEHMLLPVLPRMLWQEEFVFGRTEKDPPRLADQPFRRILEHRSHCWLYPLVLDMLIARELKLDG